METAQSWESICQFYRELAANDHVFSGIADLAEKIAASRFRDAGLCGLTSMHDLVMGPTTRVLGNPHLLIRPDFLQQEFEIEYRDGSPQPWSRRVQPGEAYEMIVHVITKYARWYRED